MFEPVSCTYTYLLADPKSRKAILIDPVLQEADRDANLVRELELDLVYVANTHVHADHITGSGKLKHVFPSTKSILSVHSGAKSDVKVKHGALIDVGGVKIEVRATPGHTNGCLTYVHADSKRAFTGDALLIRGCGRTDFQQGDSGLLYDSIHKQILSLPDDFFLYPAHDYKGLTVTTVLEEKRYNARVTKSKEEFIKIMANLNLPYPRMIDVALPANLVCGLGELPPELDFTKKN
jgi:sulfur dioxygenase